MKYIFLTLSLSTLFTFSTTAQTTDSLSKTARFQFGVNFSSDYCYRKLENNDNENPNMDQLIESRNELEHPKFGFTSGVNACYNFNEHFSVELGAQYSNKGYGMTISEFVYANPPEPGTAPESAKFLYNYHYLDIPVRANFSFGNKAIRFIGSVGLTTNFFIQETDKRFIYYADRTEKTRYTTNYDYAPVNFSPTLSLGVTYAINDRMSLRLEPTVRYGLSKIIDAPITAYLYNAGVNVGYYISF